MGADFVATGHYAKIREENGEYHIYAGEDKNKDQSYFLWALTEDQLKHTLFPIGELTKDEVRKLAKEAKLPTAGKKDSQGICFIGEVTLKDFLGEYLPKKRGNARNTLGEILGTHEGAHFYTIGQRHGLGISSDEPYYVADKNTETNTVVLAKKGDPSLEREEIEIFDVNLVNKDIPERVLVRVRYRQPLQGAKIKLKGDRGKIVFDEPQEFVAEGQSAVFYSEKEGLLGGGVII